MYNCNLHVKSYTSWCIVSDKCSERMWKVGFRHSRWNCGCNSSGEHPASAIHSRHRTMTKNAQKRMSISYFTLSGRYCSSSVDGLGAVSRLMKPTGLRYDELWFQSSMLWQIPFWSSLLISFNGVMVQRREWQLHWILEYVHFNQVNTWRTKGLWMRLTFKCPRKGELVKSS